MSLRVRRWLVATITLALCIALASCSSHASSGSTEKSDNNSSLTIAIGTLLTLDPAFARGSGTDLSILSQIYSSLTTLNPSNQVVGDLATKWVQTKPTQWTFTLRSGAKFDDGEPLDASTVVWNYERMMDPSLNATANTNLDLIKSVTAVNATTVVFNTKAPWLDLPRRMSWFFFLPPVWTKTHNPKIEAMPSGPYNLVSWNPTSKVVLKRNPNYYGTKPAFENVTYLVLPDDAMKLAALQSGEVDAAFGVDPVDMPELQSNSQFNVGSTEGTTVAELRFNTQQGQPTADVRVREAINYAINREAITESIYRGLVKPAATEVLPPGYDGYDSQLQPWPYDPAKARELLKEAGYGSGLNLTLATTGEANYVGAPEASQAIASQLGQVGIHVTIKTVAGADWTSFLRQVKTAPQMVFLGYTSQSGSANELLGQFISSAPYTWGPVPQAYDNAVAAANSAPTKAAETAAIHTALKVALDTAQVAWLWPLPQTYVVNKNLSWTPRADQWIKASDFKPAQ